MDERKRLEEAGIDYKAGLSRFMGNQKLFERFLKQFPQDQTMEQIRRAMEQGDAEAAFRAAHTLKGLAGNLSMKCLYEQASAMTEALRNGDLQAGKEKMPALEKYYEKMIKVLS